MAAPETEILETLTLRVPLLSLDLVARAWWPKVADPERAAARVTAGLVSQRLLLRYDLVAHQLLPMEAPLAAWSAEKPVPNFGTLAHKNRRRWSALRLRRVVLFSATSKAAKSFSGEAGKFRTDSVSHDLQLAHVYLRLRTESPEEARAWCSESELARERGDYEVVPDAAVRNADGSLHRVIEVLGSSYPRSRLERIHEDCVDRGGIPWTYW